jgi:hypothetical protein
MKREECKRSLQKSKEGEEKERYYEKLPKEINI